MRRPKKRTIEKTLYGAMALYRDVCPSCKVEAFVINGEFPCCGHLYSSKPEREKIKREAETSHQRAPIPLKTKKRILEEQGFKCIYCDLPLNLRFKGIKNSIVFDHFIPWNYSQDSREHNVYASCYECNSIKSGKFFVDLISEKLYILTEKARRKRTRTVARTFWRKHSHQIRPSSAFRDGYMKVFVTQLCSIWV